MARFPSAMETIPPVTINDQSRCMEQCSYKFCGGNQLRLDGCNWLAHLLYLACAAFPAISRVTTSKSAAIGTAGLLSNFANHRHTSPGRTILA
eukprot:4898518-Amphidinium_carterae.2